MYVYLLRNILIFRKKRDWDSMKKIKTHLEKHLEKRNLISIEEV